MRKRRWVGATAALISSVVIWGLPAAGANQPTSPTPSTLPTPLLSVRRDPAWIESSLAGQRLAATLAPMLAHQFGGATGASGCVEVSQGGKVLYSLNADEELKPASNMKLFTSTAVLDRLGAGTRLTTRAVAGGRVAGGTLEGNLYLVGGGDPLLMTNAYATASYMPGVSPNPPVYTSLDQLAAGVKRAGIRVIAGSVLGDDSRFDEDRSVASWPPQYVAEGDVAPLSALEVNDDAAPTPPATPEMSAPVTAPARPDPTANAAAIFASLLQAEGVTVDGAAATGRAPVGAPAVAQVESAPLATEVQAMLRVSDDTAAELLTKELGYVDAHRGTTAAGTAEALADLRQDGLPVSQLVNKDGSGLDRGDRATCSLVDQLLTRAGPDSALAKGLPVAARTGTLLDRLAGTPAAGRVEAKTGTLSDVAALSGFVTALPSAPTPALKVPLVFSMLVNGPPSAKSDALIDRVAAVLAAYPKVPALSAVGPAS